MSDAAPAQPDAFGPDAFASATGASSAEMGDLESFRALLGEWNTRMNLVGPSGLTQFWLRHAYDSAQLLHVEHSVRSWADVGAGAGFPGVVLAILSKRRGDARVHLIEATGKRIRFLETVCNALALPAMVHHGRAEALAPPADIEVVTARACAPLTRLLGYTESFFQAGARGVFLKGREVEAEVSEAQRSWKFRAELLPSHSDPSGRILRIEGLTRG